MTSALGLLYTHRVTHAHVTAMQNSAAPYRVMHRNRTDSHTIQHSTIPWGATCQVR